ncbi:4'-phosphopantetheinyl transferase family protein [Roseovarius salinarum]|uniref:4'-phosphopantetheinyl transferase family protein n=1 Tax=Roseovarius salinarum TaxID=1981892 RepID=UPI000C31E3B3|nr:4'-phosphopantetheinyl transferase superfamily protein [Roseovarius salinarum]
MTAGVHDTLEQAVRGLFGPHVGIGVTDPTAPPGPLYPGEGASMAHARSPRRREFAAGRAAARAAMRRIGRSPAPVPPAPDRSPVWPPGMAGSISHSDRLCLAVIAPECDHRALGVDLEPAAPLEADLFATVCTAAERAWLDRQPEQRRGHFARALFSAKECAYKAQYPISRQVLDFHAFETELDFATGVFRAAFTGDVPGFPAGTVLSGRHTVAAGHIVTALALPPVGADRARVACVSG